MQTSWCYITWYVQLPLGRSYTHRQNRSRIRLRHRLQSK